MAVRIRGRSDGLDWDNILVSEHFLVKLTPCLALVTLFTSLDTDSFSYLRND